jgi:anaerobic magnesium-protoporphyrin IX monomethyl ester cyclase
MKILMLNPPFKTEFGRFSREQRSPGITKSGTIYYPVWLLYATGVLEAAGHNVKLIDSCAYEYNVEKTCQLIREFGPELAVVNTSTPSIYNDVAMASQIKRMFPDCYVVLVGTHPTALPDETLNLSQEVDAIARREYEYTLRDLAQTLGSKGDLKTVLGLTFRNKDGVINNPDRPFINNLDELPFISEVIKRHLDGKKYFFAAAGYPMIMIFTGRGCPNQCFYCIYPQVFHGREKYRLRSAENVVAEFEYIINNFPEVKEIGIEDDTFTADLNRVKQICRLLIAKEINHKVKWWVNARVNLDYESMELMKKAGCRLLIAGFESGNQQVLNSMKKGIKVDQSTTFVRNSKRAGLLVHGCFMVGNPGETHATMRETLNFAKRLNTDTAQFFPLMVYPGAEAYEWAKKNSFITTGDYSKWVTDEGLHNCIITTDSLTSEDLVNFCDRARKEYYLRPRYIINKFRQLVFESNERKRIIMSAKKFLRYLVRR